MSSLRDDLRSVYPNGWSETGFRKPAHIESSGVEIASTESSPLHYTTTTRERRIALVIVIAVMLYHTFGVQHWNHVPLPPAPAPVPAAAGAAATPAANDISGARLPTATTTTGSTTTDLRSAAAAPPPPPPPPPPPAEEVYPDTHLHRRIPQELIEERDLSPQHNHARYQPPPTHHQHHHY